MNICILSTATPLHQAGGTEVHAEMLARLSAAKGHNVSWITTAHPESKDEEEKDGYRVFYLRGTSHHMSRAHASAWWRESSRKILELQADAPIDIIWAENFSGQYYAAKLRAKAGIPVISIIQGLGIEGEIRSFFSRVNSPGELIYFLTRYAAQTIFYYIPRFYRMISGSDLLVAISDECVEEVEREFPGCRKKIRKIYNFTDTSLFSPDAVRGAAARRKLGIAPGKKAIIMAGVVHKQKGFHLGLLAFERVLERFPDARLVIAGDGPDLAGLKALVSEKEMGNAVIFTGGFNNRDLPALYNAADIYLNPTLRVEGLPLAIAEAMSCALPGVVSKIGGTGSTIEDGVSGFFIKPGDVSALAEKATELLGDQPLASSMGTAARAKALRDFSENNIDQYLQISRELVKAGK